MQTTHNQRWLFRRDSYRPAGEQIRPADFEVAAIDRDATAKAFVLDHHYSGSYPAARFRFGLHRGPELVGVAVFSHPCSDRVLDAAGGPGDAIELGRFVLLDSVAGNGETWFLARCFELLRIEGLRGVVSFSDPTPRQTASGAQVFAGHIGTIYQAHNAVYLGRATPRTLRMLPDGTVLSARAIAKLRAGDRGWRYTAELLCQHGAEQPNGDLAAWAATWIPRLTRAKRHHGNHKYVWGLDRRAKRSLPASLPYPKAALAVAA